MNPVIREKFFMAFFTLFFMTILFGFSLEVKSESFNSQRPLVVLISLDGLRNDAVNEKLTPNLHRMATLGIRAQEGRTILPSWTLPSHTSMLTGLTPETHKQTWNFYAPWKRKFLKHETIFDVVERNGGQFISFISKNKLYHIFPNDVVKKRYQNPSAKQRRNLFHFSEARTINKYLIKAIEETNTDFIFGHYREIDAAGHLHGWMGAAQRNAIKKIDTFMGEIIKIIDNSSREISFIITSDHGGHGRMHGSNRKVDVNIPWLFYSNKIHEDNVDEKSCDLMSENLNTYDTAVTVSYLLRMQFRNFPEGINILQCAK